VIKALKQVKADIVQYSVVDEVTLVAVTKNQELSDIKKLVDLGVTDLGENRPQELRDKYDAIPKTHWHMIGRLQRNKIKYLIDRVTLIHSIASADILNEINKQAGKHNKIMSVLLQVSPSQEESKQGLDYDELETLLDYAQALPFIKVEGLMCMAPIASDDEVYQVFMEARKWYDDFKDEYHFQYLSMGMSSDYVLALQAGANMLRIGSLLFQPD
jgi:PLP dependent protein